MFCFGVVHLLFAVIKFSVFVLQFLQHSSVHADQIYNKSYQNCLKTHADEDTGENQGLNVTTTMARKVVIQKTQSY